MKHLEVLLCGLVLASSLPGAQEAPAAVPPAPDVAELRLDNGVEVVIERVPDARHMGLFCFVKTGSEHDPAGQTGMAHLLEHLLMTAATPSRDEVWNYERWNKERSAANAMTRGPWTVYWSIGTREQMAADARRFADVLAGRARLTPELLDYERAMMLVETRNMTEAVPGGVLQWRARRLLMRGEPGGRQGIGVVGEVMGLTLEQIAEHYRRAYRPDRTLVIALGQVDPQADRDFYRQVFGPIAAVATPLPATVAAAGALPEPVTPHERVGAVFGTLAWRAPAPSHADFPAFVVAALWLCQRAHRDFTPRGREGAAFFQPGLFAILEEPALLFLNRRGDGEQSLDDVRGQLEEWVTARGSDEKLVPALAFTKRELEALLDPLPRSRERQRLVTAQAQFLYRVGMSRGAARLWGFPADLWTRIQAVDPAQVSALIRSRLQPKEAVFVALEPRVK